MGIETALLAGGGLVGEYITAQGEKKAAAAQAAGITAAGAEANQLRQPYMEAGTGALQGYQELLTPEGQAQFAEQYTSGPMYGMLQEQAEDAMLRRASATGNMRTGEAKAGLATIAPQLIGTAYANQMQGYLPLINQGATMTTGAANTAYNAGVSATDPQYQASTAMPNFYGSSIKSLGGLGYDLTAPNEAKATYGR